MNRKICIVTGSRAEYGLLYWLMKAIDEDPDLDLQIIVTGMHLSPEFGLTYKLIEADGFKAHDKLEMLLSSDSPTGMTKSLGLGIIGFADILLRLHTDILVLLGDRYEIMAAALAAVINHIIIAHIAGGEITRGAVDDSIRHSITKMAHLHFVAAEEYRRRVIQMGEDPTRVFNYGSTGLDIIRRLPLLSRKELEEKLGFNLGPVNFLVTYHPETMEKDREDGVTELLAALDAYPHAHIIITGSNADMSGRNINRKLMQYADANGARVLYSTSLGQLKYLSALQYCDLVIGNSSSAIIEAPVLKTATVNVGGRQEGRLKAGSIIDCRPDRLEIIAAIDRALSTEFHNNLTGVQSLYGNCEASWKIKDELKNVKIEGLLKKKFFDIDF
ncbi:MAG: UDP-N-acetylglucosamine 2-epimerase [Syntrophomonadaceae bacterium]|nr:UDP-N-acetylglucosamine 2-epimerase [Syntrophomonadaceae bacterium]